MASAQSARRARIAALLALAALALALMAAVFLLGAPFGYRQGLFDLNFALSWLVPFGLLAGIAAVILAIVREAVGFGLRGRSRWLARLGFLVALALIAYPLAQIQRGTRLPRIHDITTDWVDPPVFVEIAPLRAEAPNSDIYLGASIAQQQQAAYPDIGPICLLISPAEAFEKAKAAANRLHWQVIAAVPAAGRIEASDTTTLFEFVEDIVIRIRPDGAGSRIDVRSSSRFGDTDLGSNAERIRAFRAALQ